MSVEIDLCTRVEGQGRIYYSFQNGQISSVNFEVYGFRNFENLLVNKKLIEVPRITSRICGLCHVAQSIVSCKAIENMFNITPSKYTVLLRRLLMTGDHIKSHIAHIFFQTFSDLLYILREEKKNIAPNKIIKYDPEITSHAFNLIKYSSAIVNILGGRFIHPITPAIGGFYYTPSKRNIESLKKYFAESFNSLKIIIIKFIDLFHKISPPDEFSFGNPVFMGLNNDSYFDIYEGIIRIKDNDGILSYFDVNKYTDYLKREDRAEIYINFNGQKELFVGPIGRYNIVENYGNGIVDNYLDYFNKTWKSSLLFSNFLALFELLILIDQGISILNDKKLTRPEPTNSTNIIKKREGIGVLEAPRGLLIHDYKVNENKNILDKARLFIPTEMNIPLINKILTRYCKNFYSTTQDLDRMKYNAQIILRSFDPCISCATHFVNKIDCKRCE
ncbi:MAG: nickel-dependent hydrogenase large subunit [Candidatus Helarchaeota archaeon]